MWKTRAMPRVYTHSHRPQPSFEKKEVDESSLDYAAYLNERQKDRLKPS